MQALVLIPTYNERENVRAIVSAVLEHPGYRVLVIDDNSPDGTGMVADSLSREYSPRVQVLHRRQREGLGRAYVAGMQHALSESPDFICHMDCDGSHDPRDLPRLIDAAADCDLVLGSRYVPGGACVNWPWQRVAISAVANGYVRMVTGMEVRDCTAGFRCWRRETLAAIEPDSVRSNGYSFQVETLFRALSLGYTVREIPIVFTERRRGASKMNARVIAEAAVLPWRLGRISLRRAEAPQTSAP